MEIAPNSKDFKILELSNAHWVPSGYGVQTRGHIFDWNEHYDVRELAIYGLQGSWRGEVSPENPDTGNLLVVYPVLWGDTHGDKTARLVFQSWKPDVFITLYDIWMGAYTEYNPRTGEYMPIHPYWIPIVMIDHDPIPEKTFLQAKNAYRVVVPTRHGETQFKSRGVDCEYIPFGINTNVLKPSVDKKADKQFLNNHAVPINPNNRTDIGKDDFLVVMCGANKDPFRKDYPRMLTAIQIFLANNPDVHDLRYYIHSWAILARDLPHLARVLQVEKYGRICSDYSNLCGVPAKIMPRIYGAGDVMMHLSQGGGFEIPVLEALSCGVPVIGSDFIGIGELVREHGWPVPPIKGEKRFLAGVGKEVQARSMYFSPLDALQQISDEYAAAEALEDAYNHPDKLETLGEKSREFALNFDWSLVNPMWFRLFEEIREEREIKPVGSRRLA